MVFGWQGKNLLVVFCVLVDLGVGCMVVVLFLLLRLLLLLGFVIVLVVVVVLVLVGPQEAHGNLVNPMQV